MESQILERAKQEETLWRQKSRIKWLKDGERNTKKFHRTTIQRRMNNNISHIQNEQGERIENQTGIQSEFLDYFKQAHQEPNIDRLPAMDSILSNIPKLILEEHNQLILRPVDLQEVEEAMHQLKVGKVLGLDGFTSNFFHHFWDLIKMEVWKVVEEFHTLRWMYPGLNATFIALIRKEAEPSTPDKYRPIALCNIIYKIVSKVIAS